MRGLFGAQSSGAAMSIIGAEDEDFENDLEPTVDDQCSHFNSIELVKTRPTHLLVFLQHVMLQFDCAPLLCYLHADLFKNYSAKETKKQFLDFYNTFLDKGAILRVPVPSHVSYELDRTRPDLISEEVQKRYVQDIQVMVIPEVIMQLEDFRTKRMMGMTRHESELLEVESHHATERIPTEMKEKAVAETLLDRMADSQASVSTDEEKFSAIFGAVASYMKHLGVKTKTTDNKKSKGFFRKIPGMRKNQMFTEDSTRSKQRFPSILDPVRRIGGGNEKTPKLDTEGEKEKVHPERKLSTPSRSMGSDPAPSTFPIKKPVSSGAVGAFQVTDGNDVSGVSISVTSSPDSSQSETGLTSRSDPPSASEGGEVSPAENAMSSISLELTASTDIPPEESQDKDRRKTRMSGRLARSESLCVERRRSQRGGSGRAKQSRSRSDVDLQAASTAAQPPSPSQPHTPLDGGASASNSSLTGSVVGPPPPQEEVDPRLLELEQDPPNWREQVPSADFQSLSKKEIKRQEVINELFITEHAHVRMLSVLQMVFFRPMEHTEIASQPELATIFLSLDDIFEMHYAFYENLKKLRQDDYIVKTIGKTLLNRFSGSEGDWFQKLTARFCSHQSYVLDEIKTRQKRDPRFGAFIQEAEGKPQCRRLQLKDIIPTEMQRLTKYPLLLENIAKSTEDPEEREMVQQAADSCRKILNHVNEEVKEKENLRMLKDYQRRLDTSGLKPSNELHQEYKNIDLTLRKMIFEGPVTWKVTKEKSIEVQCLLLSDLLVLLQRQDDKMLLKCQSKNHSGVPEGKQMLSPIIKLSSAFLREVATDPKAFYVIFTWDSGAQIYELVANSAADRKNWTELIKSAVEELKLNGGTSLERRKTAVSVSGIGGVPFSPTTLQPPLSLAENGSGARNANTDNDKFEAKVEEPRHTLIDYLSANGFQLLCHGNAPQEKVASGAVEEVAALKRLFVGSSRQSEVLQDAENHGDVSKKKDPDIDTQSLAEGDSVDEKTEAESREEEDGEQKGKEDSSTGTPMVLSKDTMAEVLSRLQSLEQQIKQLQSVEEEHHRLQDVLCKFSISGDNFQ
ncbi:rho guanine nucleotide exchange factor 1 isoform X3 [Scleropages formosus]|uniref:rho guanine nucleotide exchange factor 1 isoform X3 n=1 Tax=Scleropages formosus TaxID=113540 RepID=UPI000878C084|nr:rho guanine nucleotide exchange factor 1 isoform X3 [Scleropages formosus]